MTYCMSELITELKNAGFKNATPHRIRHAITAGYIQRPAMDGGRNFRFSRADLSRCKKYLANVPAPGRKATLPIKFSQAGKPCEIGKKPDAN